MPPAPAPAKLPLPDALPDPPPPPTANMSAVIFAVVTNDPDDVKICAL